MGYEIIRKINIRDNQVFITGACNNVRPHDYREWECPSLTKILQEKGMEDLNIAILQAYEEGNFQRGKNKYTRALLILKHLPEYKIFDWRNDNYNETKILRRSQDYTKLLTKALHSKLPTNKFIVTKNHNGQKVYAKYSKRGWIRWYYTEEKVTIFHYKEDAEFLKKCFYNTESWKVEKIA